MSILVIIDNRKRGCYSHLKTATAVVENSTTARTTATAVVKILPLDPPLIEILASFPFYTY